MTLANGFISMCAIISCGSIAFVAFALWIRSQDDEADLPDNGINTTSDSKVQ